RDDTGGIEQSLLQSKINRFLQDSPGLRRLSVEGKLFGFYAAPMAQGQTPPHAAQSWITNYSANSLTFIFRTLNRTCPILKLPFTSKMEMRFLEGFGGS